MAAPLKQPPYSIHAEGTVLGTLLRHPELFEQFRAILGSGAVFFRAQHERFYVVMLETWQATGGLAYQDLIERAAETGLVEMAQKADLDGIVGLAASPEHGLAQARIVKDKALLRDLIDLLSDILHDASRTADPFEVVLKRARARLEELEDCIAAG